MNTYEILINLEPADQDFINLIKRRGQPDKVESFSIKWEFNITDLIDYEEFKAGIS